MQAARPLSKSLPPARHRWLHVAAALAAIALLWHGPIAQWADYHHFADARHALGTANAWNVWSNLPFALIAGWALWHRRRQCAGVADRAWTGFAWAVGATAIGSAWYHLAPTNASLVVDRLPIAWACATLVCAFMAERVDARWGRLPVLIVAMAAATAAVGWWAITEANGHGDLRPYLYLQILPMLCVPLALLLKLRRAAEGTAGGVPDGAWWMALGFYAAAKVFEGADQPVFEALGVASGHTIKHLLAAAAAGVLLRAAVRSAPASADQLR